MISRFRITIALAVATLVVGCGDGETSVQPGGTGRIVGSVTANGVAVSGAKVYTTPRTDSATTSANGQYSLEAIPTGSYDVTATKAGYLPGSVSITLATGQTATADVALQRSSLVPPSEFTATSLSSTAVDLKWKSQEGHRTYNLEWTAVGTSGGGSLGNIYATGHRVTGLRSNTAYTFSLTANTLNGTSEPATLTWAGATRFTTDVSTHDFIRIYEQASARGSGLTIDPTLGGPRSVSVAAGTPGRAQLAMYVYPDADRSPDSVLVGPGYAISPYRILAGGDRDKLDSSVYISSQTYAVTLLDGWLMDGPLEQLIAPDGNIRAYRLTRPRLSEGEGFVVRTGSAGAYHYARVLIKPGSYKLIEGDYPNRYVELEISYQETPNLPFARRARGMRPVTDATLYH